MMVVFNKARMGAIAESGVGRLAVRASVAVLQRSVGQRLGITIGDLAQSRAGRQITLAPGAVVWR
jgi:hypothetical protein